MNSNELDALAQRLSLYRDQYSEGKPSIPDALYDALEDTLRDASPNHPFLSGTAGEITSIFPKATSGAPMLSLEKITDEDALFKFIGSNPVVVRLKIDGGSLELRYRDGLLSEAVSRGRSGELGFVCTNNALSLLDIPHYIPNFTGEIRGEAVQTWEDFNEYSKKEVAAGEEAPKHPRNVVTGTMRQENPKIVRERKIRFLAYKVMGHYEELPREVDINMFLHNSGFQIPWCGLYECDGELNLAELKELVDTAPYFCDGIVISYNDRKLQQELGDSKTAPRWARAFKWAGDVAETVVESISWDCGRTGAIIPTANITPTDLGGATISRVALHNVGYVRKHKVNAGAKITIIRSGEIIPKHMETLESSGSLNIPSTCSACGSTLVEEVNEEKEDTSSLYCKNFDCNAQSFYRILHFIRTVNIEHCGPAILEAIIEAGKVVNVYDLYTLTIDDIANCSSSGKNIGKSTAKKIVESIEANKVMELTTFIAALGISDISKGTAERLVEKFGTLDKILEAKKEDYIDIRDFGDITRNIVYEGMRKNRWMIDGLLKHITFKEKPMSTTNTLAGLKFVITGTLTAKRDLFEQRIIDAGGVFQSGVNKTTSYLIVGEDAGYSKLEKAAKFNVPQITEADLEKMMEG
jgi:DNA ligase (NAD+)